MFEENFSLTLFKEVLVFLIFYQEGKKKKRGPTPGAFPAANSDSQP